jgi:hypothetical protein
MANTLKKSASKLQQMGGTPKPEDTESIEQEEQPVKTRKSQGEVMIGASFPRIVRRSLAQLQSLPVNDGKTIKDLLAEAINDLLAKYNLPQTAKVEKAPDEN